MSWAQVAESVIAQVHAKLPDNATLDERTKALDAAYPFGSRDCWPYKVWLKARKAYLGRYGYAGRGEAVRLTPLERMARRSA